MPCGHQSNGPPGRLDESARRLPHDEFAVARQLASEGHHVRALAARRGQGRTADLLVCTEPVEVKSWLSQAERGGTVPSAKSVVNKLLQAEGQAGLVVLNGRGSGLTPAAARAGLATYAGLPHRARIAAVRVLGDGFDLGWRCGPGVLRQRGPERHLVPATAPPDLSVGR
ncbi:MAG TPA: hypothetical protein VGL49_08635 [Acidimicrobiales bacterium]